MVAYPRFPMVLPRVLWGSSEEQGAGTHMPGAGLGSALCVCVCLSVCERESDIGQVTSPLVLQFTANRHDAVPCRGFFF